MQSSVYKLSLLIAKMMNSILKIIFTLQFLQLLNANSLNSFDLNPSDEHNNLFTDYPNPDDLDDSKIRWPTNLIHLKYNDLIKIDKNCRKSPDKCEYGSKRSRELDERDCFCDKDCKLFGNCCIDSAELNRTLNDQLDDNQFIDALDKFNEYKEDYDCKELSTITNSFRNLLVKSKCPLKFTNKLIRDKCELNNSSDYNVQFEFNPRDPFQTTPVTSTKTRITYSNLFCALCNEYDQDQLTNSTSHRLIKNEYLKDFKFWKVNVTCENLLPQNLTLDSNTSFDDFVKSNFTYDSRSETWSIEYTNKQGHLDKKFCTLKLDIPEELQFFIKPCKYDLIDRCHPNWSLDTLENKKIKSLCASYQSRVSYFDKKLEYRNVHCALCNFVDINQLGCPSNLLAMSDEFDGLDGRSHSVSQSFFALFDVNYSVSNTNLVGKKSLVNYCQEGSAYDYVFNKCRDLICGFDQEFFNGECILPIDSKFVTSISDNKSEIVDIVTIDPIDATNQFNVSASENEQSINATSDHQQFTPEFKKCAKISLTSDFMELKNDSIYLQRYDQIVDKGNYNLTDNQLLICVPFSPLLDKFEDHYSSIAYICLIFSIICLTLYLIVFCLVPDLRNLSGRNLSSLCVSLIIVYFCFAIAPLQNQNSTDLCKVIAFIKYYGLLASFCWTGVIAFDIYQTIRNSLNALRHKNGPQTTRFWVYSSICWLIPLLAVVFIWLIENGHFDETITDDFRPNFGKNKECWFSHRKSLLIFFVLPVGLITVLNLIFFLLTSKNLLLTTNRNKLKFSSTSNSKLDFNIYLRLFLLMGLTWMFGFLATYFDKIYLWYLFTLFNTLQGVFIFIAFACKRNVMKKLRIKLSKLFCLDQFNLNKNSSMSTSTCRTPTNQSTITHLNSSNKILGNSNQDHLSLSRSFGDLYTKNLTNNFYSTDTLNSKHDYYQPNNNLMTNVMLNQMQTTNGLSDNLINHNLPTTIQLHRQSTLSSNNYSSPTTNTFHNNSTSLHNHSQDNQFKFNYKTEPNSSQQINKWFDW